MGGRWADQLRTHLEATSTLHSLVADGCADAVDRAATAIADSLRAGGKLMVCGNGGSAADSQRVAAELASRLTSGVMGPPIALTTGTSFLAGYADDSAFEDTFERQVEELGRRGDVLMAISTSGGSVNVRRAVRKARNLGITTIALMGEGGALQGEADYAIVIPSTVSAHVQESMLPIKHVMCHAIERELITG